ncbi:MAG: ribbon-helix-helix domain-containing protein [Candidatus Thermoplasmatota archaeon]|nr:ribbon-helix-helix domain-containing protein [Candidatus Thermoplasmatota archaeon]
MPKYSTISIPKELHEEIENLIRNNPGLGYSSVAELCKEAIRLRLSEVRMEQKEGLLNEIDIEDLLEALENSIKKK